MFSSLIALSLIQVSPAADALARQLAETDAFFVIREAVMRSDTNELVREHPELTPAEVQTLRGVAQELWAIEKVRLIDATAKTYAAELTMEELTGLNAFRQSALGVRERVITPKIMIGTGAASGEVDFKDLAQATFCRRTGKACRAAADED